MPKVIDADALATVRLLLTEYYGSGKRRHTFDSIARRAGVSRSTVARLAREVRAVWPSAVELDRRLRVLEERVAVLEAAVQPNTTIERSAGWAS